MIWSRFEPVIRRYSYTIPFVAAPAENWVRGFLQLTYRSQPSIQSNLTHSSGNSRHITNRSQQRVGLHQGLAVHPNAAIVSFSHSARKNNYDLPSYMLSCFRYCVLWPQSISRFRMTALLELNTHSYKYSVCVRVESPDSFTNVVQSLLAPETVKERTDTRTATTGFRRRPIKIG
jgi:hypothetical protein